MKKNLNIGGPQAGDDNVRTFPGLPIDTDLARIALATDPTTTAEQKTAERIEFEKFLDSLLAQDIARDDQLTQVVNTYQKLSTKEQREVVAKVEGMRGSNSALATTLLPLLGGVAILGASLSAAAAPDLSTYSNHQLIQAAQKHPGSGHIASEMQKRGLIAHNSSFKKPRPQMHGGATTIVNGKPYTLAQLQHINQRNNGGSQKVLDGIAKLTGQANLNVQVAQPRAQNAKQTPATQYTPQLRAPQVSTGDNRVIQLGGYNNTIAGHRNGIQQDINQKIQEKIPATQIVSSFKNPAVANFINSDRILGPFIQKRIQQEKVQADRAWNQQQAQNQRLKNAHRLDNAKQIQAKVDVVKGFIDRFNGTEEELRNKLVPAFTVLSRYTPDYQTQVEKAITQWVKKWNEQVAEQSNISFSNNAQKPVQVQKLKPQRIFPAVPPVNNNTGKSRSWQIARKYGFKLRNNNVNLEGVKPTTLEGVQVFCRKVLKRSCPVVTSGNDGGAIHRSGRKSHGSGHKLDLRGRIPDAVLINAGFKGIGNWKNHSGYTDDIYLGYVEGFKIKVIPETHPSHQGGGHLDVAVLDHNPRRKEIRQEMEAHQETPIAQLQHQWYGAYAPLAAHITGKCGEIAINTDRRKESIKAGGQGNPIPTLYLEAANCNKKLLETAAVENPSYTHNLKHSRAKGSVGTDYGLCGMNTHHNGDKIKDPRFFNNPLWQVDLCAEMMAQNITWFHGRHKSDTIGRSILKYIKIK